MKQETELVSGSPLTFSLPFRVAVKVALPASRISCTYRNKAWLSGERGPHGLVDGSRLFLSKLELTFHHQFKARTCLAHLFPKTSHAEGYAVRRTCTGRRSFAAAMTFWARVVIQSTWRFHSGGVVDVARGGGASSALRKEEYVTSMDFRMYRSARRRSVVEGCIVSGQIGKY